MHKFLVIQTAFTGDVVLATAIAERLHADFPEARIDFLVRKGNEGLLENHPYITKCMVWDKKADKYRHLWQIILEIRRERYTDVINAHRFAASGFVTILSGAKNKVGFDKNPLSFAFTRKVKHEIATTGEPVHEIYRNQQLVADIAGSEPSMPKLYPTQADYAHVQQYQANGAYICIAPSSVWFTKMFPANKWAELMNRLPEEYMVYLIGAPGDTGLAEQIKTQTTHKRTQDLCGKLNFLQSAALMQGAVMNYTNDSAPLHFASAMNAPVTAVFCSTVPEFGFGPVRPNGQVVETTEKLACRPCGLHGHKECPQGHFKCAKTIINEQLLWWTLNKT